MWIFTNYGFFSFTQSTYRPGFIQIRSRDDRDLDDLKAKHKLTGKIIETEDSDYRWRILCRPATAARILSQEALDIDYDNFKNAGTKRQKARPLMAVWSSMMKVQRERERELGIERFELSRGYQAPSSDYLRQQSLFDDGTLNEDDNELETYRRSRRIHEQPLPQPFEPSMEEAAEFGGTNYDDDDDDPNPGYVPTIEEEAQEAADNLAEAEADDDALIDIPF